MERSVQAGPEPAPWPVPLAVTVARLSLAALIVIGVVVTFFDVAGRAPINPFNFFGFFTLQSNLLIAAVWVWVGAAGASRRPLPRVADVLRGYATTYVAIVGLVYAALLAPLGAAGGVPVPWVNVVLHVVVPVAAAADWILVRDREALPWRWLPGVLVYPAVWLTVVLIRGATDGWVPYPFLNPAQGYGPIAVVAVAIAAGTLTVGAAIFAFTHLARAQKVPAPR